MGDMRNIVVVPYDHNWPATYEAEAVLLRPIFGDQLLALHHIGSTSIPGIHAKPIIDIMPVVRDIAQVDSLNDAMIAIGYEPRGENGITGRRYFSKGGDERRSHHVHVFAADSPEVAKHLDFRDYLRVHPAEAQAYAALKIEVARQHPQDIYAYMDGKETTIARILAQAQDWRRKTHRTTSQPIES